MWLEVWRETLTRLKVWQQIAPKDLKEALVIKPLVMRHRLNYVQEWRGFPGCCLTEWGAMCEETGGWSAHWDRVGMGEKGGGGEGWVWGRSTIEASSVMIAPLTWLSWSQCDRRLATCHIIIHSHGPKCQSHSKPMTREKHWICWHHSVSVLFLAKSQDPDGFLRITDVWLDKTRQIQLRETSNLFL